MNNKKKCQISTISTWVYGPLLKNELNDDLICCVKNTMNGTESWSFKGKLHRDGGPAVVGVELQAWYQYGELHREDGGPARTYLNGRKEWYFKGKLHRTDGPAVEGCLPEGTTIEWWRFGKRSTTQTRYHFAWFTCTGHVHTSFEIWDDDEIKRKTIHHPPGSWWIHGVRQDCSSFHQK